MSNPYAPPGSRPAGRGGSGQPGQSRESGQSGPPSPPKGPPPRSSGPTGPVRRGHPARPATDPETARAALARCGQFALLVLAGLLVLVIQLPWQAASMVFFLAALGYGVRALRWCLRARLGGGVTLAVSLGVAATCLLVLLELMILITWRTTAKTQRCEAQALTVQGLDACRAAQTAELDQLFGR